MSTDIKKWQERMQEIYGRYSRWYKPDTYMQAEIDDLRAALAAATAPQSVAGDERADFEKAMNAARFFPTELEFSRTKSPSGRDEYENGHLESCWFGWQARAAQSARQIATLHATIAELETMLAAVGAGGAS